MHINDLLMFSVGYAVHNADWNFDDINSPYSRMYYVTKGSAKVKMDGMEYTLSSNHLYLIPAFKDHSDICTGHFEHYYVHFLEEIPFGNSLIEFWDFPFEIVANQRDLDNFKCLCEQNPQMKLKTSDPKIYDKRDALIESADFQRHRPIHERMESMGILFQLLSRFFKEGTPKLNSIDPRILDILSYINNNYTVIKDISELSKNLGICRDHLIRLFKKMIGCTPMHYINKKKMEMARVIIASEKTPIKEIAWSLGYDDVSYFTRIFKQYTHLTPTEYRSLFNK